MASNPVGSSSYSEHVSNVPLQHISVPRDRAPMSHDDVVKVLHELRETCRDGEYGFQLCAAEVEDSSVASVLVARAAECHRAAEHLKPFIIAFGGDADLNGSSLGSVHRGWVHVKGALGANSAATILNECERGEEVALRRYREALAKHLPETVRPLVERQTTGTRKNLERIKMVRERVRARKKS